MKSYLTTIAGLVVIIASLIKIYVDGVTPETIAILTTGAGLIAAKDYNATGGTK
jgi:hypothetical protein